MSPLQVCLEGSNWEADGSARFDCLSMAKKQKVRHTRKAGLRDRSDGAEAMEQWREDGKMSQGWIYWQPRASVTPGRTPGPME